MTIHKEGHRIVYSAWALFLLLAVVIYRFWSFEYLLWYTPLIVLPIFITAFFRKPDRVVQTDTENLLSPCDGKVVVLEKIEINGETYWTTSIFMSIWNVHINWIPISGVISHREYKPGDFLVAWTPKSSDLNEQAITHVKNKHGEFRLKQIAGAVARRIITYPNADQMVQAGQELGFIRFGSRVDVIFPTSYTPQIKIGDKVSGIKTVLAKHA